MKKWFTSDWHLGEDRIGITGKPNLFYRPFTSIRHQNHDILYKFISSGFQDGDELWHLGDVVYDFNDDISIRDDETIDLGSRGILNAMRKHYPNSKFNLIIGNYDEDKLDELGRYFDSIQPSIEITLNNELILLNHYPSYCKTVMAENPAYYQYAITGHIHGLWKVQRNMINVGVDAWHFKPVAEDEIKFCWNAMQKFYDNNVFPY